MGVKEITSARLFLSLAAMLWLELPTQMQGLPIPGQPTYLIQQEDRLIMTILGTPFHLSIIVDRNSQAKYGNWHLVKVLKALEANVTSPNQLAANTLTRLCLIYSLPVQGPMPANRCSQSCYLLIQNNQFPSVYVRPC